MLQRVVYRFSVEILLSHSAENFRRRPIYFLINFGERKLLVIREGVIHFFRSKTFCLLEPKKRRGTLLCFTEFLVPKKFEEKRGGEYQDFPSIIFCLTMPKNFAGEPLFVSQNFWYRKNFWRRGGWCQDFPSETFCLIVTKNFLQEPFFVSQNFWYGENLGIIGGTITILRRKRFRFTVPKNFVGEPFNVPLFLGIDNIYASEGYVIVFCRKFFVSQCRNFSYETPLVFHYFRVTKKVRDKRGGDCLFSVGKFLSHTADKFCRGTLLCCFPESFWYRRNFWRKRG